MPARISFTLPRELSPADLPAALRERVSTSNGRIAVETGRPLLDVKALADWAIERNVDLPDLDVRRPSLEDVYLRLTSESG